MEHESFENQEIADIMNKHFVNIKVDREENPGVDKLYMTYVQLTAGRGGWPMSVFLTPDLCPFFGATYFPPEDTNGSPGFKTLLRRVADVWELSPEKLKENGETVIKQLRDYIASKPGAASAELHPDSVAAEAYDHFATNFDSEYGGFTDAPKFPTPVQISFLMNYYGYKRHDKAAEDKAGKALNMALFTLERIAAGGIHDHVGSGFHRYSTDKHWHVPHFEKMLYDQAQLLSSYVAAHQITKEQAYADIAKDIIRYVSRDLQHSDGGFYSAEDADSFPTSDSNVKLEGAFCVWEQTELNRVLGQEQAAVFNHHYGVRETGNVDPLQDPYNELKNKNVLTTTSTIEKTAKAFQMSPDEVKELLGDSKSKLWSYRKKYRPAPHLDDKILTSWNGLMISGLSQAAQVFGEQSTLDLATDAARFIHKELYQPNTNILLRSYRHGPSTIEGFLDDYSFLIQGLLDLYEATFDEQWIEWAHALQTKQNELFYDEENGGYFSVRESDKSILVRLKDEQDGAEPSANAVSLKNLVRLGTLLEEQSYVAKAQDTLEAFELAMSRFPFAMPALVDTFLLMSQGVKQIVLTGEENEKMYNFEQAIRQPYVPNKLVVRAKEGGIIASKNATIAQLASSYNSKEPMVHICENFTCGLPIGELTELRKRLEN
ncbi:Spermatoproteinsis-associated protein 20 [Apophysomyces ossiformis]|uniref:Spermatoproteinsis-associated protein 20 n=1 Tax=Apophysomyces ossiformis TaxID=679940 RepID=A0A8H7BG11_9FUNG|nr:Spermatoproteinsis-associated protein 20 [Apophysomyces ossiformis]